MHIRTKYENTIWHCHCTLVLREYFLWKDPCSFLVESLFKIKMSEKYSKNVCMNYLSESTLQTWHSRVCGLLLWTAFDKKFLHTWNNTNMQKYNNNEWFSLGYLRNTSKVFRGTIKIKTWGPDLSSVSIKQMLLLPLATKWRATKHLPSVFKTSILKCWKTGKCIFLHIAI